MSVLFRSSNHRSNAEALDAAKRVEEEAARKAAEEETARKAAEEEAARKAAEEEAARKAAEEEAARKTSHANYLVYIFQNIVMDMKFLILMLLFH